MGGLPSFESGFSKGQVVLDFENSAVKMPSAERDIRNSAMFNDGSWLGLNAMTGSYRDDSYNYFFRQSGRVETQGECSSTVFGVKEGYIYGGPSFWEAMRTTNASNIGFHDEDISPFHLSGRKWRHSERQQASRRFRIRQRRSQGVTSWYIDWVILQQSFTRGPRYMNAHYLDALAICRVHGNPTFTCNINWPEIKRRMEQFFKEDRLFGAVTGSLAELPLGGRSFTWMNKALDRFLILGNVIDLLPDIRITALDRIWSDHNHILLHDLLDSNNTGFPIKCHDKFRILKSKIRQWNNNKSMDRNRKTATIEELSSIDKKIDACSATHSDTENRLRLLHELEDIYKFDSMDLIQKARVQ
nr:RNA-directed DNA polymerase, eukaryota, reverse transcriptase zinc-binding domain protein [Tanacetum cinerariifolium]